MFGRVASMLRCITKTNGPAAAFAKKGLHEMEAVISHMDSLGVKWRTVLAPGLVYNAHHFSGVVFQVVANVQRKKKTVMEVLAAGGRYDHLVRIVFDLYHETFNGVVPILWNALPVSIRASNSDIKENHQTLLFHQEYY